MLLDAIKEISAAEKAAHLVIMQAQRDAQQAIAETQKEGEETLALTLMRAESEIAHLIRAMDQRATSEAMELASTTANRRATQRARAERRLEEAVLLIYERIVNV